MDTIEQYSLKMSTCLWIMISCFITHFYLANITAISMNWHMFKIDKALMFTILTSTITLRLDTILNVVNEWRLLLNLHLLLVDQVRGWSKPLWMYFQNAFYWTVWSDSNIEIVVEKHKYMPDESDDSNWELL